MFCPNPVRGLQGLGSKGSERVRGLGATLCQPRLIHIMHLQRCSVICIFFFADGMAIDALALIRHNAQRHRARNGHVLFPRRRRGLVRLLTAAWDLLLLRANTRAICTLHCSVTLVPVVTLATVVTVVTKKRSGRVQDNQERLLIFGASRGRRQAERKAAKPGYKL